MYKKWKLRFSTEHVNMFFFLDKPFPLNHTKCEHTKLPFCVFLLCFLICQIDTTNVATATKAPMEPNTPWIIVSAEKDHVFCLKKTVLFKRSSFFRCKHFQIIFFKKPVLSENMFNNDNTVLNYSYATDIRLQKSSNTKVFTLFYPKIYKFGKQV